MKENAKESKGEREREREREREVIVERLPMLLGMESEQCCIPLGIGD